MKTVHVAVGVVKQNDTFFVCKRAEHQHQGGLWEFPGGKVEAGETVRQALVRELAEEIGIEVHSSVPLIKIEHAYPDKRVCLDVHLVTDFTGKPKGLEGQESQWLVLTALQKLQFPEANKVIIEKLQSL